MLIVLEVPTRLKDGLVSARLVRTHRGWGAYLVFHDGRTFYTEDKTAADELDGLMVDCDYFLGGFLSSGRDKRFAAVEGTIGLKQEGGGK